MDTLFPAVPPVGTQVLVELAGFGPLTETAFIDLGRTTAVDMAMRVARVAETVTFVGEPLPPSTRRLAV